MIAAVELAVAGAVAARLRDSDAWAATVGAAHVMPQDWARLNPAIREGFAPYTEVFVSATAAGLEEEPRRRPVAAVHATSVRADESVSPDAGDAPQAVFVTVLVVSLFDAPGARPGDDLGVHDTVSSVLAGQRLLLAGWNPLPPPRTASPDEDDERPGPEDSYETLQWRGSRVTDAGGGRLEIADEFSLMTWGGKGTVETR